MALDQALVARLQQLIEEGERLRVGNDRGSADTLEQCDDCAAWLVSAQNAVHVLCGGTESAYRQRVDAIASDQYGWVINQAVGQVRAILQSLLRDAEAGLLASVADHARAEVLDDFLDTADQYAASNRKNESGAIAGVAFEDTIRRICRKHQIDDKDQKLDQLISGLVARGQLTGVQAKRARAAAHVRTKATHAQWDEFELGDVQAAIQLTRELISARLDA